VVLILWALEGMHLNKWTPDFSPENDIPSVVSVWVRLPFLPLHHWNHETLRNIGNSLGKLIDRVEPREGFQACAKDMCGSRSGKRTVKFHSDNFG
jgi:hypothetical protein